MLTSSAILDVVIAAIVLLSIYLGARRGLFRTLAELASYIAAYVAASVLSGRLAVLVAKWIRPMAESKLHEMVGDYLSGLREDLPDFLSLDDIGEIWDTDALDAGPFIEQGLHNLAYMLSFVVIFIAALLLLRLLIRAADLITKLPVIHQCNALGGVLIGAAKGILIVFLLLWIAKETGLLVSQAAMERSYFVPILQRFLPL